MAKFVPQAELPVSEQAQIRREKLAALQAEGRDPFLQTKYDFNSDSAAIKANYAEMEGKIVKIAGRLMSKRGQGKVMFCDLQDCSGRIQLFVKIDELARRSITASRRTISAISWVWKARSLRPRPRRSLSVHRRSPCCLSPCCLCLRSSTA